MQKVFVKTEYNYPFFLFEFPIRIPFVIATFSAEEAVGYFYCRFNMTHIRKVEVTT
jgi:hypothetical protein